MTSLITSNDVAISHIGKQTLYNQESHIHTPTQTSQETYMQDFDIQSDSQAQLPHIEDEDIERHNGKNQPNHTNQVNTANQQTLSETVEQVVRQYFAQLEGELPTQLYDLILTQVEKPLLSVVLEFANGNQSKSAEILGLNRGTLRKKLKAHALLDGK